MNILRTILLSIASLIPLNFPLQAQFICKGPACNTILKSYGGYYDDFQSLYIPKLNNDLQVSQAIIATSIIPYHVNLDKFTFGVYGAIAYTDKSKVLIQNHETLAYKNLPETGFAVQPGGYFGFNLGWLLALSYNTYAELFNHCVSDDCYIELPFVSRFDIYGFGSQGSPDDSPYTGTRLRTQSFNSRGFAVRFHAINPNVKFASLFKFEGISTGYSSFTSKQTIRFNFTDEFSYVKGPFEFDWKGGNQLDYYAYTRTQTVDARTGITLLKSLTLYAGAGGFSSRSDLQFTYVRNGEIKNISDVEKTQYNINVNSNAKSTINGGFYIAGVNFGFLTLQGTSLAQRSHINNKHAYTILLGLTFNY